MGRASTGTVSFHGNPARWWARVTVYDEVGERHRPWIDLERPDLKNTLEDKKAAKRAALKRAKVASKAKFVGVERAAAPKVTLAELEDRWAALIDRDPDLQPSTKHELKRLVHANVLPVLGSHAVIDVSTPTLRTYFRDLRERLGAQTVRNIANALTRFFGDVKAEHWAPLTINPMRDDEVRDVLPPAKATDPEDIVQLAPERVSALLGHLIDRDPYLFGVVLLEVTSGTRDGEPHGLRFSDVAEEDGILRANILRQALVNRDGLGVKLGPPKRNSKRKIPIHVAFYFWLEWWRAVGWKARVGRNPGPDDYVFPSTSGELWRPNTAGMLQDALEAAGLPVAVTKSDGERKDYDAQSLRHTFATVLGAADVNGEVIDRLLGHKSKTTRGKHYQASDLPQFARAVATIRIALPGAAAVASSAPPSAHESSNESSNGSGRQGPEVAASSENRYGNGEVAKRLGNGLQNRHTRVRIPSSPPGFARDSANLEISSAARDDSRGRFAVSKSAGSGGNTSPKPAERFSASRM